MKKLSILMVLVIIFMVSCKNDEDDTDSIQHQTTFRMGVLLSLTGTGASTGQSSEVAITLAQQDINLWLSLIGNNARIQLVTADTKTDTAEALKQLKSMYDQGIRFVIGPYSSAEVTAIKPFADAHSMLVVSPSSVAVSLAIPGDNIYRFVTSDVIQGQAMAKMLEEDSIRAIVPVIRDDVWGNDLLNATSSEFSSAGGVVQNPVKYDPNATDFNSILAQLDANVASLLTNYTGNQIGVYLCSFGEGTNILSLAGNYPNLRNVIWYGSSAFAQNSSVISDTVAAGFASSHNLPCPIFGLELSAISKWAPLIERIEASIHRIPEVYALTAYDAVWVGLKTYLNTGPDPDIETLKFAFTDEANNYFGVTGSTSLDANGDRAFGNYDFWAVGEDQKVFSWHTVARYNSATGILTRLMRNDR